MTQQQVLPAALAGGSVAACPDGTLNSLTYIGTQKRFDKLKAEKAYVLLDADYPSPLIYGLKMGVEEVLQKRIRVGAYFSSLGQTVLGWHEDAEDVLAVAVQGGRHISLRVDQDAEPTEVFLTAQDALFMPAGVQHCITGASAEQSVQLCLAAHDARD